MVEQWKDVQGYENLYQISNLGNVKSLYTNKIMKLKIDKEGYASIGFVKNNVKKSYRVHRLVALHFCKNPNPEKYNIINHKDGIRNNNVCTNLEWCDNSYNQWHRCHVNMNPPNNDYKKKPVRAYMPDGNVIDFNSVIECANYFDATRTAIERKLKGKSNNPSYHRKKTRGVFFEYIDKSPTTIL